MAGRDGDPFIEPRTNPFSLGNPGRLNVFEAEHGIVVVRFGRVSHKLVVVEYPNLGDVAGVVSDGDLLTDKSGESG